MILLADPEDWCSEKLLMAYSILSFEEGSQAQAALRSYMYKVVLRIEKPFEIRVMLK